MSAVMIGALVNAAISVAVGLYGIALGRGHNFPPARLQGSRRLILLGSAILLVGIANSAMSLFRG
jgi:hypothetical protein